MFMFFVGMKKISDMPAHVRLVDSVSGRTLAFPIAFSIGFKVLSATFVVITGIRRFHASRLASRSSEQSGRAGAAEIGSKTSTGSPQKTPVHQSGSIFDQNTRCDGNENPTIEVGVADAMVQPSKRMSSGLGPRQDFAM
eukprot:gnl/TRDRNA2_/TRDRNA2_206136_c0_seq1.p1 gnl/TRDRNA2_/TRDRNA2_206136_c0~~gnl/TRDRNA2_/TRDRNA2_206136_c0_seq1.p1  ORF type:complete len:139 (+),score=10.35 gnl/TRDRNA2_/TRDRNA2_206136_c0_seq1:461-877(+)